MIKTIDEVIHGLKLLSGKQAGNGFIYPEQIARQAADLLEMAKGLEDALDWLLNETMHKNHPAASDNANKALSQWRNKDAK